MSARKFRKTKVTSAGQKFTILQDLFPEIAPDVVQLMLDSCEGDLDEAHNHLRELDLEIWASKNSKRLIHVLPDSVVTPPYAPCPPCPPCLGGTAQDGIKSAGDSSVSLADSLFPTEPRSSLSNSDPVLTSDDVPLTAFLDADSESTSPSSSTSDSLRSERRIASPEGENELTDNNWTTELSSDFALNDKVVGAGGAGGVMGAGGGVDGHDTGLVYETDETSTTPLQLTLDKDLAVRLIMTFGLMNVPIDCNDPENMVVNLDMHLAYKLYQAWKMTQEASVLMTAPETAISEDEKLARCLQECEHENYAEQSLKDKGLHEIMDETYALSLAERDSNGRGMDLPSSLHYQSSGGGESKWVDVLLRSHNLASDNGYPTPTTTPKNVHAVPRLQHAGVNYPSSMSESTTVRPSNAKTIVVTPVTSRQSPSRNGQAKNGSEPVDYFGARQEALELQKKAVDYGARAGKAYADRKTGGGVAAYYLQKSHETKSLAKEAHLAASMSILSTRNLNAGDGEIDLHGLRMEEVGMALDDFFERKHTVKEIKIISGRGVHSRTGTSEVRRMVGIYLSKHGYKYEEGPPEGVFYVQKWQKSKLKPP